MSVDFDKFLHWAESRFGDVVVRGEEVLVNSIFCEDRKRHMWCNPSGGKTNCEAGVYHCWKSDRSGTLIGLVMMVDKCSYSEAVESLGAISEGRIEDLERRVREIFEKKEIVTEEPAQQKRLELPEGCYSFSDLPSSNDTMRTAREYLRSRMIDESGLFVCTHGRYRNRVVIPYYDPSGRLFYYNGRYIGDPGKNLRYLGPPKELGIGKGDVLFVPDWPPHGDKIYVSEGEFDAMSLRKAGLYSAALGGKAMTQRQMELLSPYEIVLCLDADDAGGKATSSIASELLSSGKNEVRYVRPSLEYKDWNGLLVAKGPKILAAYVRAQEKKYDSSCGANWEMTRVGMKAIIS